MPSMFVTRCCACACAAQAAEDYERRLQEEIEAKLAKEREIERLVGVCKGEDARGWGWEARALSHSAGAVRCPGLQSQLTMLSTLRRPGRGSARSGACACRGMLAAEVCRASCVCQRQAWR